MNSRCLHTTGASLVIYAYKVQPLLCPPRSGSSSSTSGIVEASAQSSYSTKRKVRPCRLLTTRRSTCHHSVTPAPNIVLPGATPPDIGLQSLHGIPFQVGAPFNENERASFLLLRGTDAPVSLSAINSTAHHIIFAHRQLDSHLMEGGPLGEVIAYYTVTFADGSTERLPIRERFEIATVPVAWGQLPFLAVPDQTDALPPRFAGHWGNSGERLTEADGAWPRACFLWSWANPFPDKTIASIGIEPAGPAFLLAAITLSHLDEEPFCRTAPRTIKISLLQPGDATIPMQSDGALSLTVDRGIATFPYPLPVASSAAFLEDPMRGFGQAANKTVSPAYAHIAASPSATLTVRLGQDTVGNLNWGDLETAGSAQPTPRLHVEVIDHGRNWVKTTVVDDTTGTPIPCRVHFRSPEGVPYAPHGHHAQLNGGMGTWHVDVGGDVRLGNVTYAYIDGRCEGWLPRGEVIVDVSRGFEYEPLRTRVIVEPGQQHLTLRLKSMVRHERPPLF